MGGSGSVKVSDHIEVVVYSGLILSLTRTFVTDTDCLSVAGAVAVTVSLESVIVVDAETLLCSFVGLTDANATEQLSLGSTVADAVAVADLWTIVGPAAGRHMSPCPPARHGQIVAFVLASMLHLPRRFVRGT